MCTYLQLLKCNYKSWNWKMPAPGIITYWKCICICLLLLFSSGVLSYSYKPVVHTSSDQFLLVAVFSVWWTCGASNSLTLTIDCSSVFEYFFSNCSTAKNVNWWAVCWLLRDIWRFVLLCCILIGTWAANTVTLVSFKPAECYEDCELSTTTTTTTNVKI